VVAGTATATAGAVNRHQQKKVAEKEVEADQQAAENAPPPQQPVYQQAPPQPVYQAPPPSAPEAPAEEDMVGKITQLAKLRDSGVLSDEEFSAAKAKLLGM
jgi:hypothetical protein